MCSSLIVYSRLTLSVGWSSTNNPPSSRATSSSEIGSFTSIDCSALRSYGIGFYCFGSFWTVETVVNWLFRSFGDSKYLREDRKVNIYGQNTKEMLENRMESIFWSKSPNSCPLAKIGNQEKQRRGAFRCSFVFSVYILDSIQPFFVPNSPRLGKIQLQNL